MSKRRGKKPLFSLAPVEFRGSQIEGRGVFARRRFEPGDVIVAYAPKQRKVDLQDPEAVAAADTKLTLVSEGWSVIIPDTSVPGGWLCNHSCNPNAEIYSDGDGRIQCIRNITPGEEVTIFYGWITQNQPGRDPCRCGAASCRGYINFDLSNQDAEHAESDSPEGVAFRQRFSEYSEFLLSIGQHHVIELVGQKLVEMRARTG